MVKSQRARLRRGRTGKSRVSLRQQRVLQLARRHQVLFQLRVLLTQFLRIFGNLLLSLFPCCNVARGGHQSNHFPFSPRNGVFDNRHPEFVAGEVDCLVHRPNDCLARLPIREDPRHEMSMQIPREQNRTQSYRPHPRYSLLPGSGNARRCRKYSAPSGP